MSDLIRSATITPAYGRDYKSRKDAIADFVGGKDFECAAANGSPNFGGRYCSISDFADGAKVQIRYKRLAQVVFHTVKKEAANG